MKIFLAQQNYKIGDFTDNLRKIVQAVKYAGNHHADMVVFSELCICGFPPKDFLQINGTYERCMDSINTLKAYTNDLGVIVGAPHRQPSSEGGEIFNSAYFLYQGDIQHFIGKRLPPSHSNKAAYFTSGNDRKTVSFKGKKIALIIGNELTREKGDTDSMEVLMSEHPDYLIHLSADAFQYKQTNQALNSMKRCVEKYHIPLAYCNAVGAQTEMILHGGSFFIDASGKIPKTLPLFKEAVEGYSFNEEKGEAKEKPEPSNNLNKDIINDHPFYSSSIDTHSFDAEQNIQLIHEALVLGIKDYFRKSHLKKAIIGLSGGIDSAVVLALACEALGEDNVFALLLPSYYSSDHSISDAKQLAKNLNVSYDKIAIGDLFNQFLETVQPLFGKLPTDTTEENIQARLRGNLLMAMANKWGYVLINTSNKSELSVGYGTLYGDLCGGISPLGDLYKSQVYALAKDINLKEEVIPKHILTKAPSAELAPGQKDSDTLPDYAILDTILFEYINKNNSIENILSTTGYELDLIKKVIKRVNDNEYKRHQFCPILNISDKPFGNGRMMPIVAKLLPILVPLFYLFFDIF